MSNIQVSDNEGVRTITFNRPDKFNALSLEMYHQLTESIIDGEADDSIKVFLFCGDNHCFTSGNDIQDFLHHGSLGPSHPAVRFLFCLLEIKKPMIAAVDGNAIGIGTTILLHCDLIYASTNASFQLPFVNLGLVPEAGASMLLPQLVGYHKAAELLLLGEKFDAETAHQLKLVNAVIAAEKLHEHSLNIAKKIAKQPATSVQITRKLMRNNRNKLQHQMYLELEHFSEQLKSSTTRKILSNFLKK